MFSGLISFFVLVGAFFIGTKYFKFSKLLNLCLSFVIYSFISVIFSYGFFVINVEINQVIINSLFLLTIIVLQKIWKQDVEITRKEDLMDYLLLFLIPLTLFLIVLINGHNGARFPIISDWDSAAHYSMMKTAFVKKSLLYHTPLPAYSNILSNPKNAPTIYPPGFYIVAANLLNNIRFIVLSTKLDLLLTSFFYFEQLTYICISVFFLKKSFEIFNKNGSSTVKGLYFIFIFFFLVFTPNLVLGFSSYISALMYFACAIFLLSVLIYKNNDDPIFVFLLMFTLFLISCSWFIIVPPLVIYTFFLLISKRSSNSSLILFVLFGLLISIPIIFQTLPIIQRNPSSITAVINNPGGSQQFSLVFYLFLISSNLYSFLNWKRRKSNSLILSLIYCYIGYLILIGGYQLMTAGRISYYFYKTSLVLLILASFAPLFVLIDHYDKLKILEIKSRDFYLIDTIIITFALISIGYYSFPKEYFNFQPLLTKEEQNTVYILKDIYNLKDMDITVYPNKNVFILWNGSINEKNSSFYKEWSNWILKPNQAYSITSNWLAKDTSKEEHLIVDQACWFNPNQRKSLQTISKTKLLWYRPGCLD